MIFNGFVYISSQLCKISFEKHVKTIRNFNSDYISRFHHSINWSETLKNMKANCKRYGLCCHFQPDQNDWSSVFLQLDYACHVLTTTIFFLIFLTCGVPLPVPFVCSVFHSIRVTMVGWGKDRWALVGCLTMNDDDEDSDVDNGDLDDDDDNYNVSRK